MPIFRDFDFAQGKALIVTIYTYYRCRMLRRNMSAFLPLYEHAGESTYGQEVLPRRRRRHRYRQNYQLASWPVAAKRNNTGLRRALILYCRSPRARDAHFHRLMIYAFFSMPFLDVKGHLLRAYNTFYFAEI